MDTEPSPLGTPPPATPAPTAHAPNGWYPTNDGRLRWWNEQGWTDSYQAVPPQVVVVNQSRGTNHVFHLLMSVITIGLWIPVWIIVAIVNAGKRA